MGDTSEVIIYPPTDIKTKKKRRRPLRKHGGGGAFETLKSLAFSLLDQWLFTTTTEEKNRNGRFNNNDTKEVANSSGNSHPMRYLFLLGVLPTTFGSLYSLGYTPLQIMVIGAYIVTSYFIFVEKNPDKNKEDISESLEKILSTVIRQLPVSNENSTSGLENSFKENNSYFPDKNEPTLDFELSGLL